MTSKTCKKCGENYDLEEFYIIRQKNKPPRIHSYCKDCCKQYQVAYMAANKDKHNKWMQISRFRRYGVELSNNQIDHVVDILHRSCCEICGQREVVSSENKAKALSLDHNHKTSTIRGLLCHRCNAGLGHFKDSPDLLIKAAEYLNRTKDAKYGEFDNVGAVQASCS